MCISEWSEKLGFYDDYAGKADLIKGYWNPKRKTKARCAILLLCIFRLLRNMVA